MNPLPPGCKPDALPDELHPQIILAESIGVEPIHRLPSDGLAIHCLAARPTLRIAKHTRWNVLGYRLGFSLHKRRFIARAARLC